MYDFKVEIPTRTGAGGGGRGRKATGGAYGRQPPLTNYRFLGIDGSSSSAHRPPRTSEKPKYAKFVEYAIAPARTPNLAGAPKDILEVLAESFVQHSLTPAGAYIREGRPGSPGRSSCNLPSTRSTSFSG